jgi:hypothetical protein
MDEYVDRRTPFTVALEPEVAGLGRLGIRYRTEATTGSRERAIETVKHYVEKLGASWKTPASVEFHNGHWEIRRPHNLGGTTRYDVSEDGELLCVYPGY